MSDYFVHETAEVSERAVIGKDSKIWNQVQIRENVHIGEDCIISKNVYIDRDVTIGDRVKIQNNVNVYCGVTIEDDVFCGPSMTFTNDMYPRAFSEDWEITGTLVKKGASIGANATVRCGIVIGEYAMIGAGSVVTKDVKPYALMIGNPAKQAGWVCECGHILNENGSCPACGKTYNIIEW